MCATTRYWSIEGLWAAGRQAWHSLRFTHTTADLAIAAAASHLLRMTAPSKPQRAQPALVARMIHGSLIVGVVFLTVVSHFIMRPSMSAQPLPPMVFVGMLGASLLASALAILVFRPRVPERSADESPDLYWSTAGAPAIVTWSVLEGGAFLGIIPYMLGASPVALGVAAIAVVGMIALNPGRLERA